MPCKRRKKKIDRLDSCLSEQKWDVTGISDIRIVLEDFNKTHLSNSSSRQSNSPSHEFINKTESQESPLPALTLLTDHDIDSVVLLSSRDKNVTRDFPNPKENIKNTCNFVESPSLDVKNPVIEKINDCDTLKLLLADHPIIEDDKPPFATFDSSNNGANDKISKSSSENANFPTDGIVKNFEHQIDELSLSSKCNNLDSETALSCENLGYKEVEYLNIDDIPIIFETESLYKKLLMK